MVLVSVMMCSTYVVVCVLLCMSLCVGVQCTEDNTHVVHMYVLVLVMWVRIVVIPRLVVAVVFIVCMSVCWRCGVGVVGVDVGCVALLCLYCWR